ncbi:lysM and putative peptidoglycan-binding domain-containing protein 1 isoform X2 [Aplysia californica]|uniref:LysM and putative peptidoglycan-binding domain-containing protein 1 isoform X2 n=1 Tax=Aplysia californica TaxID=6500 RepID=A0ABM0K3P0_APLCA|nr:lysM and putative peptidoglycan-binding domain-containing protein 1 isoform X2 [Aplysia californica]XP_005108020.1 lysM and putative peptidoglycan-binding domain-containing protein 1 isoform X2 [Aplysia californica]
MSSHFSGEEERRGLTHSFRSQMGYGTAPVSSATIKSTPKTRRFILRQIQQTDTLMGIALKYGTTVQDLKKENKLWTSDHLFLHQSLLIPLSPDNQAAMDQHDSIVVYDGTTHTPSPHQVAPPVSSTTLLNGTSPHAPSPPAPALSAQPATSPNTSSSSVSSSSRTACHTGPGNLPGDKMAAATAGTTTADDSDDFFSKYDCSIAKLKGDIAKMESNAVRDGLGGVGVSGPSSSPLSATSATSASTVVHADPELMESETCC